MYFHRFDDNTLKQPSSHHADKPAFVLLPLQSQAMDWCQWLYQTAFEEARREMLAEQRARMLTASLN
jgi:hypothetical protein